MGMLQDGSSTSRISAAHDSNALGEDRLNMSIALEGINTEHPSKKRPLSETIVIESSSNSTNDTSSVLEHRIQKCVRRNSTETRTPISSSLSVRVNKATLFTIQARHPLKNCRFHFTTLPGSDREVESRHRDTEINDGRSERDNTTASETDKDEDGGQRAAKPQKYALSIQLECGRSDPDGVSFYTSIAWIKSRSEMTFGQLEERLGTEAGYKRNEHYIATPIDDYCWDAPLLIKNQKVWEELIERAISKERTLFAVRIESRHPAR